MTFFPSKTLLFFLLIITYNSVLGQTEELDTYHTKKRNHYKHINNDSLIYYSKKLQQSKDSCIVYNAKVDEATGYYKKKNYSLSEEKCLIVLSILKDNHETCYKRIKINALNRLFWIKKNQNDYQEAFEYLLKKKNILESFKDKDIYYLKNQMAVDIDMASIKSILDLDEEAIDVLKNTYNKYMKSLIDGSKGKLLEEANLLNSIGDSYFKLSKDSIHSYLDSAEIYYTKSFEITKKFKPRHKNSEPIYNLRIAKLAIIKNDYKTALSYLNKHVNIEEEYQTQQRYFFLKSHYFYHTNNIDSALYYGKKYLNYHSKLPNNKKDIIKIYNVLTEIYFNKKQTDSASKYSKLTLKNIDEYNNSKSNINNKYRIYDYNKIKTLNNSIIKKENNNKYIITGILTLLIAIITLIAANIYRKKQEVDEKLDVYTTKENQPKKEYNIDDTLKNEILSNLEDFEKSTDYLDSEFTIQVLSEKLNTNTSYLSSIINSNKKKTFKQYITDLKINYLIDKLNTENMYRNYSIEALGKEIGYKNASSFTRAFKKYMKVTPSQYIKSLEEI